MQQAQLIFAAVMLTIPVLGCGGSNSAPVTGKELTPDAVAEQEAVLNEAEAAERMRNKQ